MSTPWVFDLDNTLVATRAASLAAYRAAGVEPPENFAVRPWRSWCDPEAYAERCRAYPGALAALARPLPALGVLRAVGGRILTASSRASYDAVLALFPVLGQYEAVVGVPSPEKLLWLRREETEGGGAGVYLDDDTALVRDVRRYTGWQALDTSGF